MITVYECTSTNPNGTGRTERHFRSSTNINQTHTVTSYNNTHTCSCRGFKTHKHCKHVDEVKRTLVCNWNSFVFLEEPRELAGVKGCPRCGEKVREIYLDID